MMEVKQNTAMDFKELIASRSNSNSNDDDDVAISHSLDTSKLKSDLLKTKELTTNGLLTNGIQKVGDADEEADPELSESITPELEDELLAEEEPDVVDKILAEVGTASITGDIVGDKTETLSSTSSDKLRDTGDDLDTLLSKINDIVEDCLEPEETVKAKDSTKPTEVKSEAELITEAVTVEDIAEQAVETNSVPTIAKVNDSDVDMLEPDKNESPNQKTANELKEPTLNIDEDVVMQSVDDEISPSDQMILDVDLKAIEDEAVRNKDEKIAANKVIETIEDTNEIETPQEEDANDITEDVTDSKSDKEITNPLTEEATEASNTKEEENITDCIATEEKSTDEGVTRESNDNNIPTLTLDDDDEEENCVVKDVHKSGKEDVVTNSKEIAPQSTKVNEESSKEIEEHNKPLENVASKAEVALVNLDTEDSDDDVVFFVDKPINDKKTLQAQYADKTVDTKAANDESNQTSTAKEEETAAAEEDDDDDDVVLLDDDDEDDEDEEVARTTDDATATTSTDVTDVKDTADIANENDAVEKSVGTDDSSKLIIEESSMDTVKKETPVNEKVQIKDDTIVSAESKPVAELKKDTDLLFDNSDNARDEFVVEKSEDGVVEKCKENAQSKSTDADETTSNCSSSSNLLQEAKPASSGVDDEAEVDNDDEEDADGDNDVELVENVVNAAEETKDGENEEEEKEIAPPAKRMRLSADINAGTDESKETATEEDTKSSEVAIEKVAGDEKSLTSTTNPLTDAVEATPAVVAVKRTHESLETEDSEKHDVELTEESSMKKPKTDLAMADAAENSCDAVNEAVDKDDKKDITLIENIEIATEDEEKPTQLELKAVCSNIPIPLYPPPKFEEQPVPFSLDFFKRFRKSCNKMTKTDLEELTLQKIVEAIVHKSEFAEMREIIEKQEKIIATHRTRISELSKQFRDLEMVHNRVIKDIEVKNSQFIMPVKITRAVGLQVYIPNKKNGEPTVTTGGPTVPSSPQRMPPLTSPQRQSVPDSSTTTSNSARATGTALASAAAAAAVNTRRGCVQKITPQRPIDSSSPSGSLNYRSHSQSPLSQLTQIQTQNSTKILNKNAAAGPLAAPRNRFAGPALSQEQLRQQQISRQQAQNNNLRLKLAQKSQANPAPNSTSQQQQFRRSEPSPTPPQATSTSSSASTPVDSYISSINQLSSSTAVSITPAKPKEKAVIDLTDEDDVVNAGQQSSSVPAAAIRQRAPAPTPTTASSAYMNNRAAPPLTRMPPSNQQMVNNKARQGQAQKPNGNATLSNISTPPGTSITRVHITSSGSSSQRIKYGHPAPLPATPPQTFNPAWKLPPPRPTIRISNLDNGIVISWTMEESMERHADCVSYQIYAYQETSGPPLVDSWRHVGDVKAMLLPMAVTLTQFQEGQRYFFAVRAVDVHQRFGPFSLPKTWS